MPDINLKLTAKTNNPRDIFDELQKLDTLNPSALDGKVIGKCKNGKTKLITELTGKYFKSATNAAKDLQSYVPSKLGIRKKNISAREFMSAYQQKIRQDEFSKDFIQFDRESVTRTMKKIFPGSKVEIFSINYQTATEYMKNKVCNQDNATKVILIYPEENNPDVICIRYPNNALFKCNVMADVHNSTLNYLDLMK